MLLIQLAMAGIFMCHIIRNYGKLRDANFMQKYGTLYTPCDTWRGRWPLIFIVIFCIRRVLVALSVGLFFENPVA